MKKLYLFIWIPINLLSVTDPFSNVTANFKDVTLNAICRCGNKACAVITSKSKSKDKDDIVSVGSIINNDSGRWKVLSIQDDNVKLLHQTSGKEYCLTI